MSEESNSTSEEEMDDLLQKMWEENRVKINYSSIFKKGLEVFPVTYIFLMILGIVSEHFYYSSFNINISTYIEITEIIFLRFDALIVFALLVVVGFATKLTLDMAIMFIILMLLLILMIPKFIWEKISGKSKLSRIKSETFLELDAKDWYVQAISTLSIVVLTYLLDKSASFMICIFIGVALHYAFSEIKIAKVLRPTIYLASVIFFTLSIIFSSLDESDEILVDTKVYDIKTESDSYKTGGNLKYLGSTRNYTFLYNIEDSLTTVIRREDITHLSIEND